MFMWVWGGVGEILLYSRSMKLRIVFKREALCVSEGFRVVLCVRELLSVALCGSV